MEFLSALNKREDVAIVCIPHNCTSIGAQHTGTAAAAVTSVRMRRMRWSPTKFRSVLEIKMAPTVFWVEMPSGLVDIYQRLRRTAIFRERAQCCGLFAQSKNCGGGRGTAVAR
jgi:hypothetical protein